MFLWLLFALAYAQLACRDEHGDEIASWFILKPPSSTQYLYYEQGQTLTVSPYSLNDTRVGAVSHTLQQLWNSNISYVLFNDEPVVVADEAITFGHTKGVWAWNENSAFLLTHSVPLFPTGPERASTYAGFGSNARIYAQTLACASLQTTELAALASAAMLNAPHIYERRISPDTPSTLKALANGTRSTEPSCKTVEFREFLYFAKSAQWNNELYSACLAPGLSTALLAETWIRGSATGPACGEYGVLDVQALSFGNISYRESQDHSKWAVSVTGNAVCVADINRMTTQYKRGGGALCWNDTVLSAVLRSAVTQTDSCHSNRTL